MKIKMEIEYTVEELTAMVTAQYPPPEGYRWEGRVHGYRESMTFTAVQIVEDANEEGAEG